MFFTQERKCAKSKNIEAIPAGKGNRRTTALSSGFAHPALRPLVLVGSGAFQMTGTELSTCIRHGQAPIVVVLNNRSYGTEREILEGPFNDIHEWQYEKICDLLGGGVGHRVGTFGDLVQALTIAVDDHKQVHVLNVLLDPRDRSTAMKRVAQRLAKRMAKRMAGQKP